jgi:uncharacterized membrane protein (UPF0127 family)
MAWLVREGKVLASVEVAESFRGRFVGLLGRDGVEGALLLRPAWSVHTLGMRFPIDVAFLDRDLRVLRTTTMRPWRLGRPMLSSRAVLEAEAGAFASWELAVGDALELRDGS